LLTDEGHAVRRRALQQNIPARTDPRRHCRLHAVFPRRSSFLDHERGCGAPPAALVARAGHSDFKTTQGYIGLAGETFREEADRLEHRLWGDSSTKNRCPGADSSPVEETAA
jgi:hypothetical protein